MSEVRSSAARVGAFIAILFAVGAATPDLAWAELSYSAPPQCPGRAELVDAVAARAPASAAALDFTDVSVVLTATAAGGFRGEVDVGGAGRRVLHGEDCGQVVAAVGLVLVLTLRNRAPPPPVPPPPAPPAPPVRVAPAVVPAAPAAWRWGVGAGVGLVAGVVPGARPTAPLFLDLHRFEEAGGLQPAFRLSLVWARGGQQADGEARASFTWVAAELDGCARWRSGDAWSFDGCLRMTVGVLDGRGQSVDAPASATRGWWAPGLAARGRYHLTDPLFVELDVGGAVAVIRDRFFFDPGFTLHRAAAVHLLARGQIGWSF